MRLRRPVRAGLVCAIVGLAMAPGIASAGQVNLSSSPYSDFSSLSFFAFNGETNNVTISRAGNSFTVQDSTAALQAGSNCTSSDANTAVCSAPADKPVAFVSSFLGDQNDSVTDNTSGLASGNEDDGFFGGHAHQGGDGNDTLIGSDGDRDFMGGGRGNDNGQGRGGDDNLFESVAFDPNDPADDGNDTYSGGAGDDSLDAGTGTDNMDGGTQVDFVFYSRPIATNAAGVTINLNGGAGNGTAGENDTINNVEDAFGTPGKDTLTGSGGGNILTGGAGDDAITGNAGGDALFGNSGADNINAQDGQNDRVNCGGPNPGDQATVDTVDDVSGCPAEGAGLTTRPVPGATVVTPQPADTKAPLIGVTVKRKIKRRAFLKSGVSFRVTSTDAVPNAAVGTLTIKPRAFRAGAGDLILAERRRAFTRRVTIRLKPSRKLARSVRKGSKLRLLVVVEDPAGNEATRRITIRIT